MVPGEIVSMPVEGQYESGSSEYYYHQKRSRTVSDTCWLGWGCGDNGNGRIEFADVAWLFNRL